MVKQNLNKEYGDWALITGASSGIGAAYAELLAECGFHLILVARNEDRLNAIAENLRKQHGVETEVLPVDLSEPEAVERIMQANADKDIGLLISNAGYGFKGEFIEQDLEDLNRMIMTNCLAGMNLAYRLIPGFKQRGRGGIIFTGSVEGEVAVPYSAAYAASKAFLHSLGTALWLELKPYAIDVLVLSPGSTDTEAPGKQGINRDQLVGLMSPREVAGQALEQIKHGPFLITGRLNKVMFPLMSRLPKKLATQAVAKGIQQAIKNSKQTGN